MHIKFKKIKIHHFLSFGDAELQLENCGYTLVTGVNKNPDDVAKSNGAGKSTIWSAICYALTGATIQGLKSNLSNIKTNDGCYVELTFDVDNNEYIILRSKDDSKYKTNLKIFINGEDKSGKGIRESQALLESYLPDLTSELIGSVIILGQGLPYKFSDNTPSGRKEVLEKLSKSDYMIQDIKERIIKRSTELSAKQRELEDKKLILETRLKTTADTITNTKAKLIALEQQDISATTLQLAEYTNSLNNYNIQINELNTSITTLQQQLNEVDIQITAIYAERDKIINDINKIHDEATKYYLTEKNKLKTQEYSLTAELDKIHNMTDVCPTCGQKLQNVIIPDTTELQNSLEICKQQLNTLEVEIIDDAQAYTTKIQSVQTEYETKLTAFVEAKKQYNLSVKESMEQLNTLNTTVLQLTNLSNTLRQIITTHDNDINNCKAIIKEQEDIITTLEIDKQNCIEALTNIQKHAAIITKMNTLIKRDFRGYLLTNIINYINLRAKEYCKYVFNNDNINISLDGNNIDIMYANKYYENLSGGEKQKIDLIIQFAIRDMMSTQLDFSSNILVLDEIFDNLDTIGCSKVLNLISEKLLDIESIFIITHHQEDLAIPYDYTITVQKNEQGVSEIR